MPKLATKESILWCIANSKLGYEFGTPERVDTDSLSVVLPILRHSLTPRTYTTFPETTDLDVADSGRIDAMKAHNKGQISVFLRSGTIFKGATQERASLRSMIVLPGATVDIKVRCVHQSKGISMGAKVNYQGVTPLSFDQGVYTTGFAASDQMTYWNMARTTSNLMACVGDPQKFEQGENSARWPKSSRIRHGIERQPLISQDYTTPLRSAYFGDQSASADYAGPAASVSSEDDLSTNYAAFAKDFDAILSKIKLCDEQVGLGLITDKGVETVEIFDAHDSWKALHGDAVKRLGPNMAGKDKASVFEYKPEKAVAVVQEVLALPFTENVIYEHKPSNGDPAFSVTGLSADKYTGEVVEFDGKVIHLMLLRIQ